MLREINDKIFKVKEEMVLKEVLEGKLQDLKLRFEKNKIKLEEIEDKLKKEHRDVERLEGISLTSIISTLMKNKEEKLEKEQQEYLLEKMRYEDQLSKVQSDMEGIKTLEGRLLLLRSSVKKYNELLVEKSLLVKAGKNDGDRRLLIKLEGQIAASMKELKEIEEAKIVGKDLLIEVIEVQEVLETAKNWGIIDIAGGDLLSSIAKHGKIDEAEKAFKKISNLIIRFNKELGDTNIHGISFSSTTMVFDIWLDNIFTDFSVQGKIKESLSNIVSLKAKVEDKLTHLNEEHDKSKNQLLNMKKEYTNILEAIY